MLNRRRFIAGTGATVAGAVTASTGVGANEAETAGEANGDRNERATVIAHRGFADTYPENTVGAFELAVQGGSDDAADRRGADWIELDVFPTCDGEIAVFHDSDLGDLTDTEGVLYETPASEVFDAEVLESGETVPSLEEAMEVIPPNVGVNIDIKEGSPDVQFGRVDDPEAEREDWEWLETVVDVATSYDNELLFSTFWEGALATVLDIDSDLPAAYLLYDSIQEGLDVTDEYDTEAVNPPLEMIYGTPFFDDETYEEIDLVDEAHARDLPVNVWTINTWYEVEQLIDAGVDGLFLDYSEIVRWGGLQS
ncbi:glycerophosphodiester phosphodiesterase [Natronococcus pandeyae]|uniref:Glycerophosphodiester phosphodiesterase n=1 Tax=Natronococcus pandeyae TaxID=2055836 RepID=A0A8J8PXQ8_9EURY|nr:glycerophosphodiester phosphodiesterase family protein [Natronococcus pandeyae]TYL36776.1 glycerophosphodiester phosphodiesterase [Natronococcus pandeyae]